jgi:hypothetical protein
MSSVWGKFRNRPTPANDVHHLSNHYEPDNETSEAWDASSNGWGHGHRRGGDPTPAMFQMIARTFDSKLAEPLLPAEPAPDALLRFGARARRGAGEPLLKRSTPAALSSANPEFVQSYASSATEEPGLPHRAGPWRLAGWGVLGVGAPSLVAVAIVILSPTLRPLTPLESTDQATHPHALSAAPAIPAADMTRAVPGESRAPLQIGEAAAPVRPDFKEGMAVPPAAIAVSPAPPPATSSIPTLASEAEGDAERFIAEVERKMDALSAEVGRKMDALSAEMDALFAEVGRLEGHQDWTSPEQNKPPAPPPPVIALSPVAPLASLPAPPPATSPVLPPASEAASERESDAMAAEVGRLEGHQDWTSPERNKPPASPPPAVAVSPVAPPASLPAAPPATSPVPPAASEAAADADRPVAAVARESDALAAEVGRLEGHQDLTSPKQATPPASPPPVIAPSQVAPLASLPASPPATSPVLPLASEAAADTDRPIAADGHAAAAEVDRLQSHRDSTSPEQNKPPSSRPAVAVSPVAREDARPALPVVYAGVADLTSDETCRRDGDRLARLRASPSGEETQRFASELGCEALRPQLQRLMESLGLVAPAPADASNGASSDAQAPREDARPAPPFVHAGVADLASDETCRRDGDRLARLHASPSGEEAQRFASELGYEALRPQLQRLMESLGLVAPAPPSAANSTASSDSVLAQVCASERAALDRLRKEPSAEAARLFWRDLKCARLRPQVRLLMDSLNATPRPLGSAAEPGEADSRRAVTIDAPTASGTDSVACRRETPELHGIRATLDVGDANRFASAVTCEALKP